MAPACGESDDDANTGRPADRTGALTQANPGQARAADPNAQPQNQKSERSAYTPPPTTAPTQGPDISDKAPKHPPYTGYGFDRGSIKQRKELMRLYRDMQRDFYAGNGIAFCRRFGTGLQSLPDLNAANGQKRIKECARIVAQTTQKIDNGTLHWPPAMIAWIRIYNDPGTPTFGGITLDSAGTKDSMRLNFTKHQNKWKPDFKIPTQLRGITGR